MINEDIVYDNDILNCFLIENQSEIMEKLFSKIIVPSIVKDELMHPATPIPIKNKFSELVNKGFIEIIDFEDGSKEFELFEKISSKHFLDYKKPIDPGEAAVISMACVKGGVVASNNVVDVYDYVSRFHLKWVTYSFILAICYELDIKPIDELDKLYIQLKNKSRKLPSYNFTDYFFNQYLHDKEIMSIN